MKAFHTVVIALLCALIARPAFALDPLSLIVLRLLRDHIVTSQLEAALAPREAELPAIAAHKYPGDLETLVDQGFPHLDPAQRRAVHLRLKEMLNDPQYAAQRDLMLDQFIAGASAARRAHQALAGLTDGQKRTIAVQAAAAYRDKEPQAREHAITLLRSAAVPLPSDLRELMLAEFTAESARTLPR